MRVKACLMYCLIVLSCAGCSTTPLSTSFVKLLAHPEEYHNDLVRVEGYLHAKYEDWALYISKDAADYLMADNALWVSYKDNGLALDPDTEKNMLHFDCKYVVVEGIFDARENGHLGLYAGGIRDVSRITELTRHYDGEEESTE